MNGRIGDMVVFKTRWGWMGVAASARGVWMIVLPKASRRAAEAALQGGALSSNDRSSPRAAAALREARGQLEGFLQGTRRELDFPVDLSGGTVFQRRVWRTILRIPYGRVRSYKWVAARVGGTEYARAVGLALGANPLPLIVPCHRVVASARRNLRSNGHPSSLGGFSGGLRTKRRLLRLEGTLPP